MNLLRDRSVVDRTVHNRVVVGSIPTPATSLAGRCGRFLVRWFGKAWRTTCRTGRLLFFGCLWGVHPIDNRRGHRLGRYLAVSHPHWRLL